MEQIVAVLEEELPKYIHEVKSKPQENAKAFAFSSFIQRCFGIESQELDFEKSIKTEAMQMRGRIDAVFENIIIEFKKDLSSGLDVAKEELHKYFQSYLERSETNFLGIANDGIHFKVFYPIIEENKVVGVEEKDSINLEKSSAQQVFQWFDSYLFSTEKITPTSADIKRRFGLASPTFTSMQKKLEILFQKIESFKPAILKYQSWNKYLEVVYGDKLNEKALFFKHTYLSTLVKLIVHARISGGKPNNFDEIVPILFGNTFSQAGIRNFIEEDFFSWVLSLPIRKEASKLFSSLLNEVYVYDLEKIDEDVLKELYQELVDPDVRKLLGEFYTPDWLAESMIIEVFEKDPTKSVMDPSCGSGTFLFKIIQYKIKKLSEKGWSNQKILEHIVNNVIGFDVHPLAATIAKTNYLLALKDIINSRKGPISIPVYLSDSLKIPIKKMDLVTTTHTFEFDALNKKFEFPISVAGEIGKMDEVIEMLREYGQGLELKIEKSEEEKYDFDADAYIKNIGISFEKFLSAKNYDENEKSVLLRAYGTLSDLIKNHSDAIWPYVLRNMYKPVSVSIKKVDVVIGNPPWLGLNNMKNEEYQNYIIERSKHYLLVDKKKSQNVTALNLGTLFFCQCADQYLKDGGEIAFVMPQGVLFASQHENFLKFEKNPIEITQIYDLEKVTPLFRILSCVIFGKKGSNTKYPVLRYDVHGKLPTSNSNLTNAKSFLKFSKSEYAPAKRETSKSFYYEKFSQGATIFPRCFWFVDIIVDNFLGFNPENPHVE